MGELPLLAKIVFRGTFGGALILETAHFVPERCVWPPQAGFNGFRSKFSVFLFIIKWEFTKLRDPNIDLQIVGFPYNENPNKVPLMSETPKLGVAVSFLVRAYGLMMCDLIRDVCPAAGPRCSTFVYLTSNHNIRMVLFLRNPFVVVMIGGQFLVPLQRILELKFPMP